MKRRYVVFMAGLLTLASLGFGYAQTRDVPPGHWAKEAVDELVSKGVLTGFPDGTFRGNDPATRYQMALALHRLLQTIRQEIASMGFSPTLAGMDPKTLSLLADSLAKLTSQVAEIELRVSALEALKGKGEISDPDLLQALSKLAEEEGSLEPAKDKAEAALRAILRSAEEVRSRLDELESELTKQGADLDRAKEDAERAADLASRAFLDVTALRKANEELTKALGEVRAQLQALASKPVADLEARAQTAALSEALAAMGVRVSRVEERVKALEEKAPAFSLEGSGDLFLRGAGAEVLPGPWEGRTSLGFSAKSEELSLKVLLGAALGPSGLGPEGEVWAEGKGYSLRVFYGQNNPPALTPYLLSGDALGLLYYRGLSVSYEASGVKASFFAGQAEGGRDPDPAFSGPYRAFALSGAGLSAGYAEFGARRGLFASAEAKLGVFSLAGSLTSTAAGTGLPVGSGAALAYWGSAGIEDPALSLSVSYAAVAPEYGDGKAGGSSAGDEDLAKDGGYPYEADTRGFYLRLKGSYLGLQMGAYAEAAGDYAGSPGSYAQTYGASLALPVGPGRLGAFYNEARSGGDAFLALGERVEALEGYSAFDPVQAKSSSFGAFYRVEGPLSFSLSASYFPASGAFYGLAQAAYEAGGLEAQGVGGYFRAPGTEAGSGYLVGVSAKAEGRPLEALRLSLSGAYSLRAYLGDGLAGGGQTNAYRFGLEAGLPLGGLEVFGGFATYRLVGLREAPSPESLPDPLYGYDGSLPPWLVPAGSVSYGFSTISFGLKGPALEAALYLVGQSGQVSSGFRVRYTLK